MMRTAKMNLLYTMVLSLIALVPMMSSLVMFGVEGVPTSTALFSLLVTTFGAVWVFTFVFGAPSMHRFLFSPTPGSSRQARQIGCTVALSGLVVTAATFGLVESPAVGLIWGFFIKLAISLAILGRSFVWIWKGGR